MIRLIMREEERENDRRLGHAQCAGSLRPVARFCLPMAVPAAAPPFIRIEERRQWLLTSNHTDVSSRS
jgi:hypothetical protein